MTNIVDHSSFIEEMIAIMQAAIDGEVIEYKIDTEDFWRISHNPRMLHWNFKDVAYRIKSKDRGN